jgi:hypothetical protein
MIMAKETAAQRKTRISMLLADYDAKSRELRKLAADVETMKEQIKEIPGGTYGDWVRSSGTAREILDQKAVREAYKERGESLPLKMTEAPIVVSHVVK